jgi:flagellar export protein FliJ
MSLGPRILQRLLDQAGRRRDKAAQAQHQAGARLDKARQTADMLNHYEQEQYARRRQDGARVADSEALRINQGFHLKLRDARQQQDQSVADLTEVTRQTHAALIRHQTRVRALEAMQARRLSSDAARTRRLEQREADELSLNRYVRES